jgi:hypothetical protein
MLTIQLTGGLGNQLFQIFTTIAFSIKYSISFFFVETENLDQGRRLTYWKSVFEKLKPFLKSNNIIQNNFQFLKEPAFHFHDFQLNNQINYCLQGYFQSYKYFDFAFQQIYNMLKIDDLKNSVLNKFYYPIHFLDQTVSIHFRLGDYKKLQHIYPILSLKYYCNALKLFPSIQTVFYFCDTFDMEEVDKFIISNLEKSFPEKKFVKAPGYLADWEQLLFMSCCSHNIIANSTFSWWAAYLNTNKNKKVCYPSTWFQPHVNFNTNDLFPSNWTRISS